MPSPLRSALEVKRRGLGEGQTDMTDCYDHLGEIKPTP